MWKNLKKILYLNQESLFYPKLSVSNLKNKKSRLSGKVQLNTADIFHHEEHEDHKGKTHGFNFVLSCPSCPSRLWLPYLSFLDSRKIKFIKLTILCSSNQYVIQERSQK